jgi:hypothetical protein
MWRRFAFALVLMAGLIPASVANAAADLTQLAQAQTAPAAEPTQPPAAPATQAPATPAPDPAAPAPAADAAPEEPIGSVATVTGNATVTRDDKTLPLKVKDDIYLNDMVQTAAKSALGITFSDGTTFNLKAGSQITIDTFVYEDGGKQNAGVFDVAKGTVAFVAAAVAKTGDMKITTPTATLGIRGTSGLVEVPEGASATSKNNVNVKLYPDADGRVGRIEVNDRGGAQLGFLTAASSGFAIRPGAGGVRFAAVPISITPQMIARDTGFVRQVHSMQTFGRRVFDEQRAFRRANPGFVNPNRPMRQPGQFRQNNLPGQPGGRQNGLPGQRPGQQPGLPNRPGQQGPGAPGRQGLQQQPGSPQQGGPLQRPGPPGRANQPSQTAPRPLPGQPGQPALPPLPNRQGQPATQPGGLPSQQTGNPQRPGQPGLPPRPGQPQQSGAPSQTGQPGLPPRAGTPRETALPPQPGRPGLPAGPAGPGQPRLSQPPGQLPGRLPAQPYPGQPLSGQRPPGQQIQGQPPLPPPGGGQFRQGRIPGAPGLQQPGQPGRPALQVPRRPAPSAPPPPRGKKQRDVR